MNLYRGIDTVPVLAKCGAIIPMDGRTDGNGTNNPDFLELTVCIGGQGEFSLWEDDGYGTEFQAEHWAETKLCFTPGETSVFTIHAVQGNTAAVPQGRKYRLRLLGTAEGIVPEVWAGTAPGGLTCC